MSADEATREIHTFCRVCEPACALVAEVSGGEVRKLSPDREHPVSQGFACHKGIAALDVHRDPDRVDRPLRRTTSGDFEEISWETAFSEIAERLQGILDRHGPPALGAYLGNPLAFNTLAGNGIGSFLRQLDCRHHFGSGTQDCSNKFAAGEAVFGSSTIHPVPDLERSDHILIFGENPRVSHMSFLSIPDPIGVLRAAGERGACVRFVNPRRIEPERGGVGEIVQIRPDTDVYLMAAMLHELDAAGLFRDDVLDAHAKNVAGLRAFIADYRAERVADVVGIPADEIRSLAREFGEAESACVHMSTGVNMGRQGTLAYWLLQMLSLVTGNLDRPGGNLYALGFYPAAQAGRSEAPEKSFFDSRWGRLRRIRGSLPGNLMPEMLGDDAGDERVRALFVVAGNPVLSVGGEARMRGALEDLELLVCVDLYRSATGELADYVLPSTDMLERPDINLCGLGMQHRPYVQYSPAVVAPRGERRPEWWIFARLEQAMGLKSVVDHATPEHAEALHFGRIDHMLGKSGLSIEKLQASPHGTALLPERPVGRFFEDWIQTGDRRVDCCPPLFEGALEGAAEIFEAFAAAPAERLQLITLRDSHMHNSWYANLPRLRRGRYADNAVHMNPDDVAARGLAAGQRVRVHNEHGAIELAVEADDSLRRGVVAVTHGWGNAHTPGMRTAQAHPGQNPNRLLPTGPGSFDPLSNQAFMTGVPVEVEALSPATRPAAV